MFLIKTFQISMTSSYIRSIYVLCLWGFYKCLHYQLSSIYSIFLDSNCISDIALPKLVKNQVGPISVLVWSGRFDQSRTTRGRPQNVMCRLGSLKPTERVQILLKHESRDFQNNLLLVRQTNFYATISGNFERLQYFNFETNFLKNEKIFQKTRIPFFN